VYNHSTSEGGVQDKGGNDNQLYNNTIVTSGGFCIYNGSSNTTIRNNICYNNGSDGITNDGSMTQSNNSFGTNPQFVNFGARDLHLTSSTPTSILGAGQNLSGIFTTDIDGATRPPSGAWDIGADQLGGCTCPSTCTCTITACVCDPPTGAQTIWLTFEEGSGTIANDIHLNGNTGTLSTTLTALPVWSAGRLGVYALHFAGTGDYLNINLANPVLPTNWTIAFSINADDAHTGVADTFPMLATMTPDGQGELSFNWDNAIVGRRQSFVIGIGSGTYNRCTLTSPMSNATWYRIALTYDGTSMRCYINGIIQATVTTAPPPGSIGTFWLSRAGIYWRGYIDEFILDNKAYSQDEINNDYNRNFNPPPVGPAHGGR
jgi:Concanavalin A-like lectin/glucanases superfamily